MPIPVLIALWAAAIVGVVVALTAIALMGIIVSDCLAEAVYNRRLRRLSKRNWSPRVPE